MKLYCNIGDTNLKETDCIGIAANPEKLRAIAAFLNNAANELEQMGSDFGHLHLMDEWDGWSEGTPDIQVFNEQKI